MRRALAAAFALAAFVFAPGARAQYVDGLPVASSVSGSDLVPVVQGSTKLTGGNYLPGSGTARAATVQELFNGVSFAGANASQASVTATGGTTARTLAARAADVVNALDYGVVCDGATDNATAFGRINTKTASATGQAVYFPAASSACLTSAPLTATSGTTYFANPGTVIIKTITGSAASPLLFLASGASNVTVYGLTFDGGGQDFGSANNVVTVFQSSGVVFDHVTWQHTRGIGVAFSTSIVNSGVRDSVFSDIGNHWKTTLVSTDRQQAIAFCCGTASGNLKNFAVGNYFTNIGLDSISATAQNDFLANGNRFDLANNQYNLVTASAYAAAVYASSDTQITIANNIAVGASGNAFDINATTNALVSGNHATTSGQAGISLNAVTNGTAIGNQTLNNVQWSSSAQKGGISLGGANGTITLEGNLATDTQGTKTQAYGIYGFNSASFTSLWIDQSNATSGNLTAAFGGTNVPGYSVFQGGPIAQAADGTVTGGNARGSLATDFQQSRNSQTQVASGANSVITGGAANTASGQYSGVLWGTSVTASAFGSAAGGQSASATSSYALAFGHSATADSQDAVSIGEFPQARGAWGKYSFASGRFATSGDAQAGFIILRGTGNSTSAIRLTSDGGAASGTTKNCIYIPASAAYTLAVNVVALDHTTVSKNMSWGPWGGLLTQGANAAATGLVMDTAPTPRSNGTVTGASISATADTSLGCLNLSFTPPTGNTDTWNVVAEVKSVEVQ